jgi:phosphoglycerate dehydrogenase-like enzyme
MSTDVICLRPEADFLEVGVLPPADLVITYAEPNRVPPHDLATARAVMLASVGPRLERSWLDKIPNLELVQFTGAGVDRVGDACAHRPDVIVAGIPAANAREVAEYVLFAAGDLLRGLAFADRGIRAGQYTGTRARLTPRHARSLHSRTAGVVGLGQIGLAVARLLRAVGATVCYTDPAPRDADAAASLGIDRLSLDDLLARCDLLTLHVPLLPSTLGMLGEPQLRRMPPGALLINASRGGVVDEKALARVLNDGHLGGAAVDVYQDEPPAADSPLLTLPSPVADRLLFTPHIAGVAYEAAQALYAQAWDNVRRILNRQSLEKGGGSR